MSPEKIAIHIDSILSLHEPEKKRRATGFLLSFREDLARHPYTESAKGLYTSVVDLCNYLGEYAQKEGNHTEAMRWYAQGLAIVNRSEACRAAFPDVFLRLAHVCLNLSKYALALHYTRLYRRYNPAMADFCDDVIRSIANVRRLLEEAVSDDVRF